MGLMNALQGHIANVNPEELDNKMKSGMLPPVGLHHAMLNGYRECTANSGSVGHELTFLLLAGTHKGSEVKETLWESDKPKAIDRMMIFAHRLGLLKKVSEAGKSKYLPVEGKTDLVHCMGVEVIIDVHHEEWEREGKKGTKALLTFEGVLSLDDKRAAKVPRGTAAGVAGVTVPSGAAGNGGSHPAAGAGAGIGKQATFADL